MIMQKKNLSQEEKKYVCRITSLQYFFYRHLWNITKYLHKSVMETLLLLLFLEPIPYDYTIIIIIKTFLFYYIIKMKQYITKVFRLLYWEIKVITA